MNHLQRQLKRQQLEQMAKRLNCATVYYLENGSPRQQQVKASTEEKLLENIFMLQVDAFPEKKIIIKQVHYHGQLLYWNEFLAHSHFAKSKMSFEDFKTACLDDPKKGVA